MSEFPEKDDPQRLMVLYSSHEFQSDREEVVSFWTRLLSLYCQQRTSLVIDLPTCTRDYTLCGIYPTSLELVVTVLQQEGKLIPSSELLKPREELSSSSEEVSVTQVLSRLMSTSFAPTDSKEDVSSGLLFTPLLSSLEKDIVEYTKSVSEKSRIHYVPESYLNSSLFQYINSSARPSTMLLKSLLWEDVRLLLKYMQKNGTVAFSDDDKIVKFIVPQVSKQLTASNNSVSSSWWPFSVFQGVSHATTDSTINSAMESYSVTSVDKCILQLEKSKDNLNTRIDALESRMEEYRRKAAQYKGKSDMYMAKIMLKKMMLVRKHRDSTAAALLKLEMAEHNVEECETQKEVISAYQIATQALKQARMITTTETETRTILQPDGTSKTEEVVVGVTTRELTLEDVEEAMATFEEEAEIISEIGNQLAGDFDLSNDSEEMAALEEQLEALALEEAGKEKECNKEHPDKSVESFPNVPTHAVPVASLHVDTPTKNKEEATAI